MSEEINLPEEIQKITHGFVVQTFNTRTKELVDEALVTGWEVEYEDTDGCPLEEHVNNDDFVSDFGPMTSQDFLDSARGLAEYSIADERKDYIELLGECTTAQLSSHPYIWCITILGREKECPYWDDEKQDVVDPTRKLMSDG